ncbi:MAG: lamin tail domain-containing protein [Lewinellaceae bacterium]|nr:lamin tail domain-containing protein [Lewinellaceae bacterium]
MKVMDIFERCSVRLYLVLLADTTILLVKYWGSTKIVAIHGEQSSRNQYGIFPPAHGGAFFLCYVCGCNQNTYSMKYLFLLLLLPFSAFGQIADDFSDGNFSANPGWDGSTTNFVVNAAGQLQLMAPAAGASTLYTHGNIPDSAVWELYFRLDFAPSTSNLLRIYLQADQADLSMANGYCLEIGETGNLDALRFMRQDAGIRTLLAAGIAGAVALEPVDQRLRIRRSANGNWTIEMAPGTGGAYGLQASVSDATYLGGSNLFFGFYCLYTATRTDKFIFDDINIQADVPDTQAPVLLQAQADNSLQITAVFNEALDPVSAENPANYNVLGIGQPNSASLWADERSVQLNLPAALPSGNSTLQTSGIADISGNISGVQSATFAFFPAVTAAEYDVLINEIMADPTPSAGLPDVEWVELYNRSNKVLNLNTLRFSDGGTPAVLPDFLLQPDSFVVLCASSGVAALAALAYPVRAVSGFPGLNNDGETLTLTTANGTLIDQVAFSINWHTDNVKRNGGWTLERINPDIPCLGGSNWQSCPVLPGGTPGKVNASLDLSPDVVGPQLLSAFPGSALTLQLQFSEGLDAAAATDLAAYALDPMLPFSSAQLTPGDNTTLTLTLGAAMAPGQVYALTVNDLITDCSGNAVQTSDPILVGLPEMPAPGDVVINEILFNPASGGSRFVEFYNHSNKIFSWENMFIANFQDGSDIRPVALQRLFLPGEYIVFTANRNDILSRFTDVREDWLLSFTLPSLTDQEDNITLYWSQNGVSVTLDSVDYNEAWHNAFYTSSDREGVSLERIRSTGGSNDPGNWTSAAGLRRPFRHANTAQFAGAPGFKRAIRFAGVYPRSLIARCRWL